jgi:hypothetical protein
VMSDENWRDVERELSCRAGDVGIWEIHVAGRLA